MNGNNPMTHVIRGIPPLPPVCHVLFGVFILLSSGIRADTLVLKDGRSVAGKTFVRQANAIFLTVGADGQAVTEPTGIPVTEIAKVDCDVPVVLGTAPPLLAVGKFAKALEALEPALKVAETYMDVPGCRWPELFVLRAHILLAMGKDADAATMASTMKKTKSPNLVCNSKTILALIAARKGDHGVAASLLEEAMIDESSGPSATAAASVVRGLCLLEKKQYPDALKAFLELPVFLPDETALSGMALLGSARAYYGMEDFDRSITVLESLIKTRPETPEIATAETLLPEWKRRRRVIEEAKEP